MFFEVPDAFSGVPEVFFEIPRFSRGTACVSRGTACVLRGTACVPRGTACVLRGTTSAPRGTTSARRGTTFLIAVMSSIWDEIRRRGTSGGSCGSRCRGLSEAARRRPPEPRMPRPEAQRTTRTLPPTSPPHRKKNATTSDDREARVEDEVADVSARGACRFGSNTRARGRFRRAPLHAPTHSTRARPAHGCPTAVRTTQ